LRTPPPTNANPIKGKMTTNAAPAPNSLRRCPAMREVCGASSKYSTSTRSPCLTSSPLLYETPSNVLPATEYW